MNAWGYIALISIGIIAGMILHWYLVQDRIQNRKIEIRKNKQKNGTGNLQDLEVEMREPPATKDNSLRDERREARRVRKLKRKAERQLKKTLNNQKSTS